MRYLNITGQKFNRLTAIEYVKTDKFRMALWSFKCDCGNICIKQGIRVKYGKTKSCGCLNDEVRRSQKRFTKEELKNHRKKQWAKYYKIHREKLIKKNSNYTRNYKKQAKHDKERKKYDISFRIKSNLHSRLLQAMSSGQKGGSFIRNLGCSIDELKKYLESKFKYGMTWENYGVKGWHIDHIKPLSCFDLTDKKQFCEACHYKNLQPLWRKENIKKSNNYKLTD